MSLKEARDILGLGVDATPADIRHAHRRLMQQAHPDKGGTTGLAAQLNAARDRLLKP
jgi:curved DNA-binding protein CbpA